MLPSSSQSARQAACLEVERVDVLVLLGRVLGVLDRAVRPHPEPLRVLGCIGMIGRALECDVERDLDPARLRGTAEVLEVLERPQLRVDRLVAALDGPDGPRAARVVRPRRRDVVTALAVDPPDRVDRRKVQHVEAHGRDVGQPRLHVPERAVAAGLGRAGPREQLVPGTEPGALAIDDHDQLRVVDGRKWPFGVARHLLGEPRRQGRARAGAAARRHGGRRRRQLARIAPGRPPCGCLDQRAADQELHGDVLAGIEPLREVPRP